MRTTIFASVLALTASGCATLTPVHPMVASLETAVVTLKERDHDLFKLDVVNTSNEMLVVDRDAITLERHDSIESRRPGGFASTYVIPPGGHHAVNVKFDLAHLGHHGDPVYINLDHALLRDGVAVAVDPIELRVD